MSSNTEISLPFFGLISDNINYANLCALGIPWSASSSYRDGADHGPTFIRSATSGVLYNTFTEMGLNLKEKWQIYDPGNLQINSNNPLEVRNSILEQIKSVNRYGMKYFFMGGDHLSTYFTFWSLKQLEESSRVGIIYLDAHPDLYDSYNGNKHSHACVLRRIIEDTHIDPTNVIQVGIRAATPEQSSFAQKVGIKTITTKEFLQNGSEQTAEIVKGNLPNNLEKIYISIDLDVLDPAFAPGVGNPQPGGLTTRDLMNFIQNLYGLKINAFDIVELCPKIDYSGITAFASAMLIKEMLGIIQK
ncbi:MAG TPA: agmatinase [candidate division Zixibacteria bacterium]|nr:agmatinase [candidate division Zixibacteria bacterium]